MDAYIRLNKVWTPEQMHTALFDKVKDEIRNGQFAYKVRANGLPWTTGSAIRWLNTEEGRQFALDRFQKKYNKDKPIADRNSPIVERIRFGWYWSKSEYFDINFGLKDKCNFIETDKLKKLSIVPWSVEHVNNELNTKYDTDLIQCLNKLSDSTLEKLFVKHWIKNYYSNENPAIIPEICGLRDRFFYYKYGDNFYTTKKEIRESYSKISDKVEAINFRYDFLVVNFKKQKTTFIELYQYHLRRVIFRVRHHPFPIGELNQFLWVVPITEQCLLE